MRQGPACLPGWPQTRLHLADTRLPCHYPADLQSPSHGHRRTYTPAHSHVCRAGDIDAGQACVEAHTCTLCVCHSCAQTLTHTHDLPHTQTDRIVVVGLCSPQNMRCRPNPSPGKGTLAGNKFFAVAIKFSYALTGLGWASTPTPNPQRLASLEIHSRGCVKKETAPRNPEGGTEQTLPQRLQPTP